MKKEYVLRIVFCDNDEEIELLTEYCDDIEDATVVFEVDGAEVDIPKAMEKALLKLDNDILGLS